MLLPKNWLKMSLLSNVMIKWLRSGAQYSIGRKWLVERTTGFKVTFESVYAQLTRQPDTLEEKAFQGLFSETALVAVDFAPQAQVYLKGRERQRPNLTVVSRDLETADTRIVQLRGHISF